MYLPLEVASWWEFSTNKGLDSNNHLFVSLSSTTFRRAWSVRLTVQLSRALCQSHKSMLRGYERHT